MVDSVVSFVLKVTEDRGRKLVTQKLRSGGAFAHSLSNLIEAELSTMRRQLEALTRKDLDESIDLGMGSKGGAVVRALASHQCGPGSNPGVDAICGLSLLLVLSFAPRGFSPGTPVFPSP